MRIKSYIAHIRNSKDGKVLVSNFAYLSLLQVAGYIFPLITLPYLARVIGVEGLGKIAFASAIMLWFQTITDWGFSFSATRDVAKVRNDIGVVSAIFSKVLWGRCLLMLISFLILLFLIAFIPQFRKNTDVILVSFLMIPGHIIFPEWFFQAMERMRYITILNFVSKTIFTIAVFIFIKDKDDYILQPLLNSIGFLISGFISLYWIIFRWKIRLIPVCFSDIIDAINNGKEIFLVRLIPNLYNSFSSIFLGIICGDFSNGILDAGRKFVTISIQFMNVLSRTFFPFIIRRSDKHGLYAKINLSFALSIGLILFIFAPFLVNLFYTPEFYDAITIIRIMSLYVVFMAAVDVYGINFLIARKYDKIVRNITILSSLIGFVLTFPFVIYLSYYGVALIVMISGGIMAFMMIYKYINIINKSNEIK